MNDTIAPSIDDNAAAVPASAIAPVGAAERIDTLDFIRGLAVMGILAANIVAFGQPMMAYFTPGKFLVPAGDPDGWMWIAQFILVDGKMRGLFTLLFGAGMYLFMEKAWARGATRWLQAWRLVILLGFGLFHFYFIWFGDILSLYALVGLIVLACLKWSIKTQLWVGLAGYMLGVVFYAFTVFPWLVTGTALGDSSPEMAEMRDGMRAEMQSQIAEQAPVNEAIASGDYAALVAHRIGEQGLEPFTNVFLFGFETLPLMLIGIALYRIGFFSGAIAREKLVLWGWTGMIAGGLAHLAIGLLMQADGFSPFGTQAAFLGMSALPRLWMVIGLVALLVAYAPSATGWLGDRVRAAGRAAFTNYLGTSVVMMFLFHGWALGLFGQLNRPQLYVVVVLAWVLMLAWSKPWLDRYRYGPLEWLWRCLTYRTVFPLRK
ncbi:DUF418 domain-containing protein [Porphyrobacter sp. CACIAM 03H1]|uniref:DUF418 domain-containing protein n=1 Tax=Porphyrobacter sp. CACIAM 03H1 TaxID=2003315 RepID=UPI000B5A4E06|nr:DUF418 domain-containing protein [Porphyrobacter sp. CACIAM 03H1]ASJ92187.1 hypothetical protein CBR61_15460 [Porphyrobacter sp. CACIAM 03H1]